jgi:hypothetical protein
MVKRFERLNRGETQQEKQAKLELEAQKRREYKVKIFARIIALIVFAVAVYFQWWSELICIGLFIVGDYIIWFFRKK